MTSDEAIVVTQAMDAAIARREAAGAAAAERAPLPGSLDSLRQRAWGKLVELLEAKVGRSAPSLSKSLHLPTSCPLRTASSRHTGCGAVERNSFARVWLAAHAQRVKATVVLRASLL